MSSTCHWDATRPDLTVGLTAPNYSGNSVFRVAVQYHFARPSCLARASSGLRLKAVDRQIVHKSATELSCDSPRFRRTLPVGKGVFRCCGIHCAIILPMRLLSQRWPCCRCSRWRKGRWPSIFGQRPIVIPPRRRKPADRRFQSRRLHEAAAAYRFRSNGSR